MKISDILNHLEQWAPPVLAESYDNPGLLTGSRADVCTGILVSLDCTEAVVEEAIRKGCNLIVSHHPIWFGAKKHLRPENYVNRTLILAIRNQIALYAMHTNLDNVRTGVNAMICERLSLTDTRILQKKSEGLMKLSVYVPKTHHNILLEALWAAGAGQIGQYSEASFSSEGQGTFRPQIGAEPFIGEVGKRAYVDETQIEVVFPFFLRNKVLQAMRECHPYEEIAFQLLETQNELTDFGAGMIGKLPKPLDKKDFLDLLAKTFQARGIRYADCHQDRIQTVAVCGGSGSFLIFNALMSGADAFVTGDITYHKFFDAEGKMLIADIGHGESEQFTADWICRFLLEKIPNFAVRLSETITNPVKYHGI